MTVWTKLVEPKMLEAYLARSGWRRSEEGWKTEWEDEGRYVQIPNRNDPNYSDSMNKILMQVAEAQERPLNRVMNDLHAKSDELFVTGI